MHLEVERATHLPPAARVPWMAKTLRRSEYHYFEHRGRALLYNVADGTFFEADRVIRDVMEVCDGRSIVEVLELLRNRQSEKEVVSACKELHDAGILSDVLEPEAYAPVPPGRLEIVHLGLDITYDALGSGGVLPRDPATCPGTSYMSEDVALKAIDLLMTESGHIRQSQITFQGGDPLLNVPLVERTIDYALEQASACGKEVLFEVVGSGRLVDSRTLAYLRQRDADIIVSLEPTALDELPLFHGTGPYSLAAAGGQGSRAEDHARFHLHAHIDRHHLDLGDRVRQVLSRHPSARSILLKFTPLAAGSPGRVTPDDLPQALAGLEDLADFVTDHVLRGNATWIGDFEDCIAQVLNHRTSLYYCGAGTRYLTVSPNGKLYVCPGLVGHEAFSIGGVEEGIDRRRQREWIKSTHVRQFPACASCWARNLCGGGCRLNSFLGSGEIESPTPTSCELIRRSYELAMVTGLEIASASEETMEQRYSEEAA